MDNNKNLPMIREETIWIKIKNFFRKLFKNNKQEINNENIEKNIQQNIKNENNSVNITNNNIQGIKTERNTELGNNNQIAENNNLNEINNLADKNAIKDVNQMVSAKTAEQVVDKNNERNQFLESIKVDVNKNNTIEKKNEDMLDKITANPQMLENLPIEKLNLIENYYIESIKKYEGKISELKPANQ